MKKIVTLVSAALLLGNIAHAAASEGKSTNGGHHQRTEHRDSKKGDETTPVDINQADATALTDLKGIGTKKAEAIVSYRQEHGPFKTVDDLKNVPGFGEKRVAKIKEANPGRITVS